MVQMDFVEAFERVAVIVSPTLPVVAPSIGRTFQPSGSFNVAPRNIITRNTLPANVAGLPAASVPCGLSSDGLPAGLQIIGPAFAEPLVLRVAAAYEDASPAPQALPLIAEASARLETS